MGFVEGRNVAIDYRSTAGQSDRLPAMAAELVSRNVAVIISIDNDLATLAAMAATRSIPIVFTTAGNPVQLGFVASLNRPGGNVTGITTFGGELLSKRLELLRELLPTAGKVALLLNPRSPATSQVEIQSAHVAARRLGLEIVVVFASTENELEAIRAARWPGVGRRGTRVAGRRRSPDWSPRSSGTIFCSYIQQGYPGFHSPYVGPFSFTPSLFSASSCGRAATDATDL
jgi:hypothetical protein